MEEQVKKTKRTSFITSCVVRATLVLLGHLQLAKEPPKRKGKAETIQRTASGTSTKWGRQSV